MSQRTSGSTTWSKTTKETYQFTSNPKQKWAFPTSQTWLARKCTLIETWEQERDLGDRTDIIIFFPCVICVKHTFVFQDKTTLKIHEMNTERLQKKLQEAKEENSMLLESKAQVCACTFACVCLIICTCSRVCDLVLSWNRRQRDGGSDWVSWRKRKGWVRHHTMEWWRTAWIKTRA